jgi:nicotinate phosphoribosyltransferase
MGIITSLLDTDFYSFSQGQVALHQFPWVQVKYKFKCRNNIKWTKNHLARLYEEIKSFCSLRFTEEELAYLSNIRFFKSSYIDFLRLYQPNINHLSAEIKDGEILLSVSGPWFLTIYWEVPVLAMISEIYSEYEQGFCYYSFNRLNEKIRFISDHPFPFADFGTRRRYSRIRHEAIIKRLVNSKISSFKGTSNVGLARRFDLTPIGTVSHQFLQIGQALDVPLIDSQKRMLQAWVDEYRGDLGIALTDVIGIDAFLKDFDLYFAKLYDGVRHDSGDPYVWARKMISHYEDLGIDPKTKTLVFSDGLTFDKASNIHEKYKNETNISFGIGTHLTNDFDGHTAPQIVMKVVECNGRPVAKISDSAGKGMCEDEEYVKYLKKVFGIK